jgi:two-component system sensor histidine kinase ResE
LITETGAIVKKIEKASDYVKWFIIGVCSFIAVGVIVNEFFDTNYRMWVILGLIVSPFAAFVYWKLIKIEKAAKALISSKEKLLVMVSHDLKNPLSIIRMASEIDKTNEMSNMIIRQTEYMQKLIGDLLISTAAQLGKLELTLDTVPVNEFIQSIVESFSSQALAKNIQLLTESTQDLKVKCDPLRLTQITSNLVSNAIKHTSSGGSVTITATKWKNNQICFSVKDTGKGISEEDIKNIFEPFHQSDGRNEGHGMGLAIVKDLVEMHGGIVWASSIVNKGTKVNFTIKCI